ncbi:alpha-1,2-mannosyltransferase MNN5 [Lachancea thermotolerans CBS 6340]|uniref:KLTH0F03938p n=1 Tax=Lachancea thermotolerans (strain ATCC 56472 / CBS 6340 / NRRL Y-8284) TaxID=559295 RepID=C5DKE2_LACTC|nr:KLTH0F03938p [Lachancea thermotolerans CBS 6340]CAR23943.1 KLTH0F03938p [Lachancea thermotolerans CBS 6340]
MHIWRRKVVLCCCVLLALAYALFAATARKSLDTPSLRERVYSDVFDALLQYRPVRPPKDRQAAVRQAGCEMKGVGVNRGDAVDAMLYENLDRCYRPTKAQFEGLQAPHSAFLTQLRTTFAYEADSPVFERLFPRERGFVTVGGGRFSLLAYSMLRALRARGSKLPAEVVIPPQDAAGEEHFCNEVLPELNARCVFFEDALPRALVETWDFERYQIKAVALLLSSFKKIVFIDADDFPIQNLDSLFDSEVLREHGLVLWPDLWRRATAPVFYRLANIDVDLRRRVRNMGDNLSPASRYTDPDQDPEQLQKIAPFHDFAGTVPDPTTESGQMVIDKVRHFQTLLLALYYNVYGPEWYYSLFSQGTAGEGDKETFATAAHVLGLPFYQVKNKLAFDGYFHPNGDGFRGVALYQHDCVEDYLLYCRARDIIKENQDSFSAYKPDYDPEPDFYKSLMAPEGHPEIPVMFAHASFHKFDPWQLYHEKVYLDNDGAHFRSFHNIKRIGNFDIELFVFEGLQKAICSDNPIRFKYLEDKFIHADWPKVCQYVEDRVKYLQDTHDPAVGLV